MIRFSLRHGAIVFAVLLASAGALRADYVGNLDPDGDNYLSLRAGPGLSSREIRRMREGTILTVIARKDRWRKVRLKDGAVGWAFGKYIIPGYPEAAEEPPPTDAGAGNYDVVQPEEPAVAEPPPEPAAPKDTGDAAPPVQALADEEKLMDAIIEDIGRGLAPAQ